jgi:hypothetical protein
VDQGFQWINGLIAYSSDYLIVVAEFGRAIEFGLKGRISKWMLSTIHHFLESANTIRYTIRLLALRG